MHSTTIELVYPRKQKLSIPSNVLKSSAIAASVLFFTACSNTSLEAEVNSFQKASVEDVQSALKNDNIVILDARSPDAFNGWVFEQGELITDATGGHIPGAQLFSARWIEQDHKDLDRGYEYANLDQGNEIIIYGYDRDQATTVADWLVAEKNWDSDKIRLLKGGISQWAEQNPEQMDYLLGYLTLVPPEYVAQAAAEKREVTIVQIGWDGGKARDYRKEHVPGAIYWDDLEFEKPPIWENRPVEEIRDSLARHGIHKDSSVIVYSTDTIMSARAAVVMQYAGVEDVVMMNGTMDLWNKSGLPTENGWNEPVAIKEFGKTGPGDNTVNIYFEEARELREQPNSALVSIRSWKEFTGRISGYNYFEQRGRIPGAIWGHAGTSSWGMQHYRNPDDTMRNYHQIAEFWNDWNITPDMNLSFYCGNGARASEAYWYARAMGYENATVYASGWMRWRTEEEDVASGNISRDESLAKWRKVSGTEEA